MAAISTPQDRSVGVRTESRQTAPATAEDAGSRLYRGIFVGLGLSAVFYAGLAAVLWLVFR